MCIVNWNSYRKAVQSKDLSDMELTQHCAESEDCIYKLVYEYTLLIILSRSIIHLKNIYNLQLYTRDIN